MSRTLTRTLLLVPAAVATLALGISPAFAETTTWKGNNSSSSDVVGAHAWGDVMVESGSLGFVTIHYNVQDTKADGHSARVWVRMCHPGGNCEYDETTDATGSADSLYSSDTWSQYRSDVTSIAVQECLAEQGSDYLCAPGWQRVY